MHFAYYEDDSACVAFAKLLRSSPRILCFVGAGLSASSGIPTWRGTNGLWNDVKAKDLASPKSFQENPVTVWRYYGERLLESLAAQPNAAHHAIAALARWHDGWLTVNQNVDGTKTRLEKEICGWCVNIISGLLERTNHPTSQLLSIHGALQLVKCTVCDYQTHVQKPEDLPFLMLLSISGDQSRSIDMSDLPRCPTCKNLLRPGIVWFGERLAAGAPDNIDDWIAETDVDLVIAAGTSLKVFPAAEWVSTAREYGAALAIFDLDRRHVSENEWDDGDWFCEGDIAVILPKILGFVNCKT